MILEVSARKFRARRNAVNAGGIQGGESCKFLEEEEEEEEEQHRSCCVA
jgi:hypothetical protein